MGLSLKKILGIIASPRRLGNCEIFVKEIARNCPESHELSLLRISEFNIKPCRGCYLCLFKKEQCILKDDLYQIIHAMEKADAYILVSPTYFLGANSSLKRLLDRGLSFYTHADKLWGKPSIGVGIAGIRGKEGYSLVAIESFLKLILSEIKASTILYSALPGEILLEKKNQRIAAELGKALLGSSIKKRSPSCPLCGGSTFCFLDRNIVRCVLCSNTGTMSLESGTVVFQIQKDDHGLFLNRGDVIKHRQWLRQEVKRYKEQRVKLRTLISQYKDEGNWIKS